MSQPPTQSNLPQATKPDGGESKQRPGENALIITIVAFAVLFYWATLYLDRHAGGFNRLVYSPYTSTNELAGFQPKPKGGELAARGKMVYARTCLPCHQASGMGLPGQFPPLAGSDWVNGVGPNRMIRIVLNGLQGPITVKGAQYNNVMVPWRDVLKDDEIAAVLTYVRNDWGNKGDPVKPADVKKIRDETASRGGAWTPEELLKVPDK